MTGDDASTDDREAIRSWFCPLCVLRFDRSGCEVPFACGSVGAVSRAEACASCAAEIAGLGPPTLEWLGAGDFDDPMACPDGCSFEGTDTEALDTAGEAVVGCDMEVEGELALLDLMAVSAEEGAVIEAAAVAAAFPGGGGSGAMPIPAASLAAPAAAADL